MKSVLEETPSEFSVDSTSPVFSHPVLVPDFDESSVGSLAVAWLLRVLSLGIATTLRIGISICEVPPSSRIANNSAWMNCSASLS